MCDASVISPESLSDLLSRIPSQTALHAPLSVGAVPSAMAGNLQPSPTSPMNNNLPLRNARTNGNAPNNSNNNNNYNEKNNNHHNQYYQPQPSPSPLSPPAYNSQPPQPNWPPLGQATALYAYTSPDAGDLELQPNDHIVVTEYMNAEWWKGRSSRTGHEGIFPRSYVQIIDEKGMPGPGSAGPQNNYGNVPPPQQDNGQQQQPSKAQNMGAKFGKKLGNAAIFGAGATMGADLVNAIL